MEASVPGTTRPEAQSFETLGPWSHGIENEAFALNVKPNEC